MVMVPRDRFPVVMVPRDRFPVVMVPRDRAYPVAVHDQQTNRAQRAASKWALFAC
jgi:hypothetical protein